MIARQTAYRGSALWIAAMVHRISGLGLAIFLPLHFLALGLAIEGDAKLESFLRWSDQPVVKFAEGGLVFLLTVHLLGGLRILVIENFAVDRRPKAIGDARRRNLGCCRFHLPRARVLRTKWVSNISRPTF